MTLHRMVSAVAAAGLAAACGGGGGAVDAGEVDGRIAEVTGACPLAERVGRFEIAHRPLYSAVTGDVYDAVNPTAVLQPAESEGGCQLLRRVNPFCDPPCGGGTVCNEDQECVPFPSKLGAGAVTIEGLTTEVDIDPDSANHYQATDVDHPPFTAGAPIWLHAAGSDQVVAFDLDGIGVEPLVVEDPIWTMVDGQPLDITWTAATGDWRVLATFNVDQHGNSPVTMYCDLADTGSATIPANLISILIDYGMSGAASGNLFRRTVDSVTIDQGCVELEVYSHRQTQLTAGR